MADPLPALKGVFGRLAARLRVVDVGIKILFFDFGVCSSTSKIWHQIFNANTTSKLEVRFDRIEKKKKLPTRRYFLSSAVKMIHCFREPGVTFTRTPITWNHLCKVRDAMFKLLEYPVIQSNYKPLQPACTASVGRTLSIDLWPWKLCTEYWVEQKLLKDEQGNWPLFIKIASQPELYRVARVVAHLVLEFALNNHFD